MIGVRADRRLLHLRSGEATLDDWYSGGSPPFAFEEWKDTAP